MVSSVNLIFRELTSSLPILKAVADASACVAGLPPATRDRGRTGTPAFSAVLREGIKQSKNVYPNNGLQSQRV